MKKILLSIITITALVFLMSFFSLPAKAQVSCPSSEMNCSEIDYRGGCQSPCIRVVTRQGQPSARGATPAQCQCQEPANSPGSVQIGQPCQRDEDCASPGKYCWGGYGEAPACHEISAVEAAQQERGGSSNASPLKGNCIDTAIGCIPLDETGLAGFILRWAIGIGGGIAFLFIVLAGFQILTSQGNPERLKAGQELLTSAIMGLILLIFSIFVLRVIGVDILAIPGFSK
jgi:hypothetical protein